MKVFLIFCLLMCLSVIGNAQGRITLEECIAKALEANYSIKMVQNQQQMAKNNLNYSPFLPTVSVNGTQKQSVTDNKILAEENDRVSNGMRSDALSAGIALNWRLFDGMNMFVTHEKYREMLSVGELNTRMAIENLIMQVCSYYYDVVRQQSRLEAVRHSLALSGTRYAEANDKYMLGVLSGLEKQQAKLDLNADSSTYMKQIEYLKSAYISLNMIMNADLQKDSYVKDSIELAKPLSYVDLQQEMLQSNTALLICRRDLKISELDMKSARSLFFPTLDLSSGYNYSRTKTPESTTTLNRTNGPYWGFSVNMHVFNGWENRRKMKNAKLEVENAEYSLQEAELQLRADLAQLYNTYENNLRIVDFEQETADVAFDNLDAAIEKYKLGTLAGIEFREFQRSYIDAVDREVAAIYQAKISELSLMLIGGRL